VSVPVAIPRPVARRIDRLAQCAHRLHRFAHHPLCAAYASEVLRLPSGRVLCRGCTCAAAGSAVGLLAGLLFVVPVLAAALLAALGLAALELPTGKLGRRFLPALGLNLAIGVALRDGSPAALVLGGAGLLAAAAVFVRYRLRGPDRSPCSGCAEASGPQACSGFAPHLRCEREFQRAAGRLLVAAGIHPAGIITDERHESREAGDDGQSGEAGIEFPR
jgi:hypothetical protein